jgi:SAM-dependent methyltransferase
VLLSDVPTAIRGVVLTRPEIAGVRPILETMSFYEQFSRQADAWSAHVTDDVDFYVALARQCDGPLVELAVGTGRVAIPVARATGRRVVGIDSSPAMLEQARTRAADAGVDLDLRLGDMRDLELDELCALIYCPARSLLHIPTWAERRQVFERVTRSLRPGGRFAWNAFAFDHKVATQLDGHHQSSPVPHVNYYDVAENRVDLVLEGGAIGSLWWATKNEWLGLIDVAGLDVETLHGNFSGSELNSDSREYVFVARRP